LAIVKDRYDSGDQEIWAKGESGLAGDRQVIVQQNRQGIAGEPAVGGIGLDIGGKKCGQAAIDL
jgi:hypothetical protein